MTTFVDEITANVDPLPSVFDHFPRPATQARHPVAWRKLALLGGLVAGPAAAGIAIARATTQGRGLLVGGLAALALGALRIELARWFTPEPAFEREGAIGALELRRYPARIEAITEVEDHDLESALDHGYGRLACYACGSNRGRQMLPRTTPILLAMREGRYTVSFVMPPGQSLSELPRPEHPAVSLREIAERSIAVLRFRGRFTRDNIAGHERVLLQQLIDSGLAARGSVTFAAFDSPLTLPVLRRNELWIETV